VAEPAGFLKSLVFSDLVVRCRIPRGLADIRDILGREVFTLAKHQAFLASKGVFVRGAICWGKIYVKVKQGLIFGPGLVQSFDLERALAIFPRIVIEAQLVQRIRGNAEALPPEDCITERDDGVPFVDYLYGNFVNQSKRPWELVQNHKRAVEKALAGEDAKRDERVRQKYLWLGRYHNWTLERLHDRLRDSSPVAASQLSTFQLAETLLRY
jgi:hypothetical protein